jgi:hypothetical protein
MRFSFLYGVLCVCIAAALNACSGISSGTAATPRDESVRAPNSWMRPKQAPKSLVYISDPLLGVVNIYDGAGKHQSPIGQLAGLQSPQGLFVDFAEDLWIADSSARQLVGYKKGQLFPFATLSDPNGLPIAICGGQSAVYAVDFESASYGPGRTVEVFTGASKPTSVLTIPNAEHLFSCATNANDDLFVSFLATHGGSESSGEIDVFPQGKTKPKSVVKNLYYPAGIAFDKLDELIVCDSYARALYIYPPPYDEGYTSKLKLKGIVSQIALSAHETELWGADTEGAVGEKLSYPKGELLDETTSKELRAPYGIAASPPGSF